MSIWRSPRTLEELNGAGDGTMVRHLGIVFSEVGGDFLRATRAAAVFARDNSNIVKLEVAPGPEELVPGRLNVSATSTEVGDNAGEIDASVEGGEVEIAVLSESYWHRRFDGARRLVDVPPSLMPRIAPPTFGDSMAVIAPADFAAATYAEPPP